jgi:hypothetical protein
VTRGPDGPVPLAVVIVNSASADRGAGAARVDAIAYQAADGRPLPGGRRGQPGNRQAQGYVL